jgi:choline dehydrogenase-like flavoprotein
MIIDLAMLDADKSLTSEVLVIGGGIAGLLLAAKLREYRIRVVVFESGAREQTEEVCPLNRVVQLGNEYRGATHGRFRCLGGTSTRWGGALIPLLEQDLAPRPHMGLPPWPIGMETVRPFFAQVESRFGVDPGSYDEAFVDEFRAEKYIPTGDPDFLPRFAKWPVFKRRNVATLLKQQIKSDADLSIWINATATSFELDRVAGQLRSVTARHFNGRSVRVTATHVVLCAGAIESTRLLLLLDAQCDGMVYKDCDALGRFFYDHISMPMARIAPRNVRRLNRIAGFRFVGTTMRSLRFELSPAAQASDRVTSAFGHISFQAKHTSGFDALRNLLRSQQKSGRMQPVLALGIFKELPYFTRLADWRYFYHQLYWPVPARYELHVVAEQAPRRNNQVSLADERDTFGLPLAAINWRIEESDCGTFWAYMRRFDRFWNRHNFPAIGDLKWLVNPNDEYEFGQIVRGGDVFHPGGSTRMGTNSRSAVVNPDLRTFAISNLWIASTSVFPSGGSANPTLMLTLLTMRLAEHLAIIIRKKDIPLSGTR